jgi:hypothetical protein
MKTYREAYQRMHEALIRIGDQFINKDGMTGGRCVELAQEILEEMKAAELDPKAITGITSEAESILSALVSQFEFGLKNIPDKFRPRTGRAG